MIIFLYGEDNYRLSQAAQDVVNKYKLKHKSGFNFFSVDLGINPELLLNAVKEVSFFNEIKLIAVKNIFSDPETVLGIMEKFDLIKDPNISVLITGEDSAKLLSAKSKELFKYLTSRDVLTREFNYLSGSKLENWIISQCQERGSRIDSEAIKTLIFLRGSDSWSLIQEIGKICTYARRGSISRNIVSELVAGSVDMSIFELTDALARRDKTGAFSCLYQALNSGQKPGDILSMIAFQFRNLIMLRDLVDREVAVTEIIKKTGLHPFVAKKTVGFVKNFTGAELKERHRKLMDIDISSKSGQRDVVDGLFNFVFQV